MQNSHQTNGGDMKYVIAGVVCLVIMFTFHFIGVAVFGWKHGGGAIPQLLLLAGLSYVFRAITKKELLRVKKEKMQDNKMNQRPKEKQPFKTREEYEAWKAQKMAPPTEAPENEKLAVSKPTITSTPILTEASVSEKDNFINKLEKKLMRNQETPSIIYTKSPLFWIGIVIIILFAFTIYPTLYRYDHMISGIYNERVIIRINRVTGNADVLAAEGWRRLKPQSE